MKEKFTPNITDVKILLTIQYLNKKGYYPLPLGVAKILGGLLDDETKQFIDCPTYQTLISYKSKKVSRLIVILIRYKYLEKIYDPISNDLYLKLSQRGELFLDDYLAHHHLDLKPHQKDHKTTIVHIK